MMFSIHFDYLKKESAIVIDVKYEKECEIMAKIATLITDLFEGVEFTSPKEALEAART